MTRPPIERKEARGRERGISSSPDGRRRRHAHHDDGRAQSLDLPDAPRDGSRADIPGRAVHQGAQAFRKSNGNAFPVGTSRSSRSGTPPACASCAALQEPLRSERAVAVPLPAPRRVGSSTRAPSARARASTIRGEGGGPGGGLMRGRTAGRRSASASRGIATPRAGGRRTTMTTAAESRTRRPPRSSAPSTRRPQGDRHPEDEPSRSSASWTARWSSRSRVQGTGPGSATGPSPPSRRGSSARRPPGGSGGVAKQFVGPVGLSGSTPTPPGRETRPLRSPTATPAGCAEPSGDQPPPDGEIRVMAQGASTPTGTP